MITRNIDRLRTNLFNRKGKADSNVIIQEKKFAPDGQHIKSTIYGGLDGIITTFAVVAGVAGASLSSGIVLILGFANLLADGLSMAIGDYLSTRAEVEYAASKRKQEEWTVEHTPQAEKQKTVEMYVDKGMAREDAEILSEIYSRYRKTWIELMMVEKLGIIGERGSPLKSGLVTFLSFCFFGLMPLLAYVLALYVPAIAGYTFLIASVLTATTLFLLGVQKIRFTRKHWFSSGLEMLVIGGVAAVVAYGIGVLLSGIA